MTDRAAPGNLVPCATTDCRMRPLCARSRPPTQWEVSVRFKPDRLVCKGFEARPRRTA